MPSDRTSRRRALFALVAEQGGFFTAAQAREIGYSYQAQAHHVHVSNWDRVDRGLFRLADWPPDRHDDLRRWALWAKGRAVVSHETALAVHDVGEFESARVHLTVPPGFSRTDGAVVLHRVQLPDVDVVDMAGFRVTTVARSLADVAASGVDGDQLARAVAEAYDTGSVTFRMLRARSEEVDLRGALAIERAIHVLEEWNREIG